MTDLSRHNGSDKEFYLQMGRLEATVQAHEDKLEDIDRKLDQLLDTSSRLQGGWFVLSVLMGAATLLGSFSHEVLSFLRKVFG